MGKPLEIRLLDNTPCDMNGLKGKIRKIAENQILNYFSRGLVPLDWNKEGFPLKIVEFYLERLEPLKKTPEENRWIEDLKILRDHLASMDLAKYLRMDKEQKDQYAVSYGKKCAYLLKPVIEGYVDKRDPYCPECPNHEKHVTQKTWEDQIDPVRIYFQFNRTLESKI